MGETLETFRHPDLGFSIDLVPGLDVRTDVPGAALVATERADVAGEDVFLANLVVTVTDAEPDADVGAFADAGLLLQERELEALRLLDREATTLAGRPAVRTLVHHQGGPLLAVVSEQWTVLGGRRAYVVTATSDAVAYADTADLMTAMAESLALPDGEPA